MKQRDLIIIFLSSLILTIIGFSIKLDPSGKDTVIKVILISVGTSIMASAIFALYTVVKVSKEEERSVLFEKMGLLNFYIKREKITDRCRELFKKAEIVDITAIRLLTLLENHENTLTNHLKTKRITIRILMPNPDSNSAKNIEYLLGTKETIRAGLKNVHEWQAKLKNENLRGSLEVRYTDKLISSMYQRIDDVIFTGPYLSKKDSQGTFTIECNAFGDYGKVLSNYFETRFNESSLNIKKRPFVVEFMGMPGAGKTTCVKYLKEIFTEIYSHSNEDVDCFTEDSPYIFNDRLINSLSEKIEYSEGDGVLFLDRGTEDLKVWLKTHHELNNLNNDEFRILRSLVPIIPENVTHYKILFIIDPETTKIRRKIERRVDEWAIQDQPLRLLYSSYKELKSSNEFIVVNAEVPLVTLKKQLKKIVDDIFEKERSA